MRLIDADAFLENNKELADCDFIHPKYCDTLRDLVNNAPTVDVFDKIRDEIKHSSHGRWYFGSISGKMEEVLFLDEVLEIIDKHKGDKE